MQVRGIPRVGVLATVFFAAVSCTYVTGHNAAYVIVEPHMADQFLNTMGVLSSEHGLTPHFMNSKPPQGAVTHMLEGSGWSLVLWLQNVPLSGQEDETSCGAKGGPHPDPAQFVFYVEPRSWSTQARADEVAGKIVRSLKAGGFDVRERPVLCGLSALTTQR